MPHSLSRNLCIAGILISTLWAVQACLFRSEKVDFNTQVKPIINRRCIVCHGGVRAKGGFSLLFRDEALAPTASGKPAIIPGDPDHSPMIRRISSKDPEERMPYQHEPLDPKEIDVLRAWVREGAPWGEHWAYVPVSAPTIPQETDPWVKNDVDRYILEKLRAADLTPAAEAPRAELLRRVSLDLTGVYPTDAQARAYLTGGAYETLVDSLLASPHFGEKWASMWLDLARYADTKGYERDDSRNIWRYRDWLIKAFNADEPYDRFLTEQLAGDLLPHPTDAQYIATAFHRNTMTNDEGGTDNEEFRTAAVLDRVNTTWEALMGTTFACTQCHSHPYDPFHHEEYYKFMAYFNDTRDEDSYGDYPLIRNYSDSDQVALDSLTAWTHRVAGPARADWFNRLLRTWQPAINSLTADHFVNGELDDTKWLAFRQNGSARLKAVDMQDKEELIYRYQAYLPGGTWMIHLDSLEGRVIATVPAPKTKGWTIGSTAIPPVTGTHDLYLTYHNPQLKRPLDNGIEYDWFCFTPRFPAERYKDFWRLMTKDESTTPVMMDNPSDMHRVSNVFERGNWLVKGDVVTPGVPQSLAACMPKNAPQNRLGLAMWMTSKQNPLVSRTMVNRVWEQLFGTGIAETLEDLGTQGSPPTHKDLMDYLAWRFMNADAWSVKRLLKDIVMSATYRQDSKVTPESLSKDPTDKLYSRGARVRLSAEQLRDQDLCICGKFNPEMYGPSVFPYQPKGIWMSPWNGAEWVNSRGPEAYRRAMYTYWKRTAAYPSMVTFDATSREVCTARRIRTNTPLQALVTLNDSSYLDMARKLAERMNKPGDPGGSIAAGYEMMLFKPIDPAKLRVLMGLYDDALARFTKDPAKAKDIVEGGNEGAGDVGASGGAAGVGSGALEEAPSPTPTAPPGSSHGPSTAPPRDPSFAALIVVANAMLNLDEVITKN